MLRPTIALLLICTVAACRAEREVLPVKKACTATPRPVETSAPAAQAEPALAVEPAASVVQGPLRLLERSSFGSADGNTRALRVCDVDGDGALDLLVGRFRAPDVLLRNDGRGGLWPAEAGSLGSAPAPTFDVVLGDVSGDGRPDVFAVLSDDEPNQLHRQRADGLLFERVDGGSATSIPAKGHAAALVDLDRDGDLDLLVVNRDAANELHLNDGAGLFSLVADAGIAEGAGNSRDLAVGDLDGDQWLDAVVANGADQPEDLLLNDGRGGLTRVGAGALATTPGKSASCDLGDVDGDGDLDLVVVCRKGEAGRLWLNDGAAGFSERVGALPPAGNAAACQLADLDRDGRLDLVVLDRGAPPRLLQGDGAGGFTLFSDVDAGTLDGTACDVGELEPGVVELFLGGAATADERWRLGR